MAEHNLAQYALDADFADASTAEIIYVPVPFSGNLVKIWSALEGAIGTADCVMAVGVGTTDVGDVTVAYSGSAAGDVDSLVASTHVDAGGWVKLNKAGASSNAVGLHVTLVIDRRY
jgi:hypothetical protein